MIAVKNRVGEILRRPRQRLRDCPADFGQFINRHCESRSSGEAFDDRLNFIAVAKFIERNANRPVVIFAKVVTLAKCGLDNRIRGEPVEFNRQGVKERRIDRFMAKVSDAGGKGAGETVHALRDSLQALWAVIDGIHPRHDRQQRLRCADIARGFIPADVLLAGLQGHAVGGVAVGVFGDADQATRHLAGVFGFGRHERGVRAAETQRYAEPLRGADSNVGAEFTGRFDQRQREQIGGEDDHHAGGVGFFHQIGVVDDPAIGGGILHENAGISDE